ncbi:ZP domain-containing protein-like [Gigantopelta aegis]|uniref:ZP domain-containing protein-like n=1 Tax=Gigantopelta aegis TaxID=1735272 RepID=UPI001B88C48D|nr:ZP domain-containing protein-like [Gigantopelta aegis]XP_041375832.1 ZP domain-containing protein-like [Gigantopelta aegis]XP_041375833.1 ZP domain-containing protein-like [Gigantopelta aegis]XP_041375834.1 ZP domain-containing protein-like [Gigantopelta aegis]XP_041375835.1 ZP domain-containing protein-like [Gigantopelta aegis]
MEIFIPVTILPRYNVTLRDPQCPVIFNGTHHVASVGLSQCGTTMQFTKTSVVFRNQLSARVTNAARSQSSRISFGDAGDLFIPVECEYPRRANVTMSYTPLHGSLRIFEKRFGHLHFQMRGFSDDTFQSEIPSTSLPMQVPLNEELHVMLSIDPSTVANIGIFADRCLATPSSSPNDPVFWSLLQNGCSMQPEVRVHRSPSLTEFRFSFNAFKFMSTDPSGSPSLVYVHCQVSVCRQHDCVTSCQGHSRSRRRRSASHHASHLVSTGPFILMKDNSGTGSSQSSIPLSLGVVASSCVAVVACLVAVVATVAWKRSKGKERTTQEPIN